MSVGVYQSARPSSVKRDTARITNVCIAPQQKQYTYVSLSKHTYCYSMITLAFIVHAYRAALDRCTAWVEIFCLWVLLERRVINVVFPVAEFRAPSFLTLQEVNMI